MIAIERAYDKPATLDGARILVDRIWPRGVKKEELHLDSWLKEVAPSTALRKWFGHDPSRWKEFQERYFTELDRNAAAWQPILQKARAHSVTLVYGARDAGHNNAVALRAYLQRHLA